jgi:hypothetical protein
MPNFHHAPAGKITFRRQGRARKSNLICSLGGVGCYENGDGEFKVSGFGYSFPHSYPTMAAAMRRARTIGFVVRALGPDETAMRAAIVALGGTR